MHCAYGTQGNAETEKLSALAALVNGTTVAAPLKLRFYDREANATLSSFTSGANTIVLTSPGELDIEKLEIWVEPNILAGIFDPESLWPIRSLSAHEEAGAVANSSTQKISVYSGTILRDFFLTPNGTDSAGRAYYGLSPTTVSLPPGSISRVVLHVKRLSLNGTFNGTPFSVIVSQATDPGYTPTCTATASLRGTGNLIPIFNYQALFSGATAAGSAHLESVILTNLRSSSGVLSEHFVLSCTNLN
jgi:hypothetical protein